MPYFERTPVGGLSEIGRSLVPIPGLPSRGLAAAPAEVAGSRGRRRLPDRTGILERADAVLASERAKSRGEIASGSGYDSHALVSGTPLGRMAPPSRALSEHISALAGEQRVADRMFALPRNDSPSRTETGSVRASAGLTVDPAPVLRLSEPVSAGSIGQVSITLANDDGRSAHVAFYSTGLIGDDGTQIPADGVWFDPRELTLAAGQSREVIVNIIVPAHARSGVYSGLIRAAKLEQLHAVLMVQVQSR